MYRSVINLNKQNIKDPNTLKADACIIDFFMYSQFTNEEKSYLQVIKSSGCDVYFGVDEKDLKNSLDSFKKEGNRVFKGIKLLNPTGKLLRKTSIYLRSIENYLSLVFGYFKVFLMITKKDVAKDYVKLVDYFRVNYVCFQPFVDDDQKLTKLIEQYHKIPVTFDKLVDSSDDVLKLNNFYKLNKEDIEKSEKLIDEFLLASNKKRYKEFSQTNINSHIEKVELAKKLGLTSKDVVVPYVTINGHERIYKGHTMRFFYSLGDDIGSAVVAGFAALMFLAFMISFFLINLKFSALENVSALDLKIVFGVFLSIEVVLNVLLCLYHSFGMLLQAKGIFKKLEDFVFYISVANLFLTIILLGSKHGNVLAVGYMMIAVVFYFLSYIFSKAKFLPFIFNVILWWLFLILAIDLQRILSLRSLVFIVLGSLIGTTGLFFRFNSKRPFTHFIWHLSLMGAQFFVLLGLILGVVS